MLRGMRLYFNSPDTGCTQFELNQDYAGLVKIDLQIPLHFTACMQREGKDVWMKISVMPDKFMTLLADAASKDPSFQVIKLEDLHCIQQDIVVAAITASVTDLVTVEERICASTGVRMNMSQDTLHSFLTDDGLTAREESNEVDDQGDWESIQGKPF